MFAPGLSVEPRVKVHVWLTQVNHTLNIVLVSVFECSHFLLQGYRVGGFLRSKALRLLPSLVIWYSFEPHWAHPMRGRVST